MARVIMPLADGFEETEAIAAIDILRRGGIEVTVAGVNDEMVKGAHGISVRADTLFAECDNDSDGVVLPGGMPGAKNLSESEGVLRAIRHHFDRGALCAAICAAPAVLSKAGILDGKKATCYPGHEKNLHGATILEDQDVVIDGNVVTSRGVGTAPAFGLAIVSILSGEETAQDVARAILHAA